MPEVNEIRLAREVEFKATGYVKWVVCHCGNARWVQCHKDGRSKNFTDLCAKCHHDNQARELSVLIRQPGEIIGR